MLTDSAGLAMLSVNEPMTKPSGVTSRQPPSAYIFAYFWSLIAWSRHVWPLSPLARQPMRPSVVWPTQYSVVAVEVKKPSRPRSSIDPPLNAGCTSKSRVPDFRSYRT